MNPFLRIVLSWVAVLGLTAFAFGQAAVIEVNEVPFEPSSVPFYRSAEKFTHPQEVASPNFLYPF